MSTSPSVVVRLGVVADADEIARLLTLLGFPTDGAATRARWTAWAAAGNEALVADDGRGPLVGVATLHRMDVLHRPHPVGRITALVVDPARRGGGVGRALVDAAERRLASAGCGLVEITSNARLVAAHAFYERLGYERTSVRLAKVLVA